MREEKGTTEDEMVGLHHQLNGHLDCFRVLAIVNSAAVNTGAHISLWVYEIP